MEQPARESGPLKSGAKLGPYEILVPLGAGGMGVVYRAHDERLERDVAVKILPAGLLADEGTRRRFRKEALALAKVNHPNIASVYDVGEEGGVDYLVTECVPGQSLAEKLKSRSLPEKEVVSLGEQIAAALEEAHEHHVVHRDLKPGNIIVTPKGQAKVLDFGLAKLLAAPEAEDITLTQSLAETPETAGTMPYMAPEQLRGEPADARTDLWGLGAVLYEAVTGQKPFAEKLTSRLIDAILNQPPMAPRALNPRLSQEIEFILNKALEKDRNLRYQTAVELRADLKRVQRGMAPEHAASIAPTKPRQWPKALAIGAGGAILALAGWAVWFFLKPTPQAPALSAEFIQLTDFNDSALAPSLSSDGRMVTFIRHGTFGASAPRGQIYVKILPRGDPVQLTHDETQKEQPVFSPDGSRIIYTAVTNGFKWDSWQVPVLGGPPQQFLVNASGLAWIDDQQLMYSEIKQGVHMGIVTATESLRGRRDIYLPPGEGSMAHRSALSPDHKSVLLVEMDGTGWLPCRLVPFDGSSPGRRVGPQGSQCTTAAWSPDGRWMYFSSNAAGGFHIWRQKYPTGAPEQITFGPTEQEGTAVAPDGKSLVTSMGLQQAALWLHDSTGERQLTSEGYAILPTMLPSGDRIFYLMQDSGARAYVSGELWSLNVTTGEKERFLPGYQMSCYSISRDGKRVVFTSVGSEGCDGVWIADLDRRSPPHQLTHGSEFRAFFGAPGEIIYMSQGDIRHLYQMKEDGSGSEMVSPDPVSYLVGVSPDGNWAAVTLQQAPQAAGLKIQLLSMHGQKPFLACEDCALGFGPARQEAPVFTWSMDGKSFYVALKYYGLRTQKIVALPYRSGEPLESLWPKGLSSEDAVSGNPGAKVINEGDAFPVSASSGYLVWRRSTQSNLYHIPLPN